MPRKKASLKVRTIDPEIMKDVATFLPMDGFKLSPEIIGKDFDVIDVIEGEFQDRKTFSVVLQNDDQVINISAGLLKRARVLSTTDIDISDDKFYKNNKNIVLRSEADAIWSGSRYLHAQMGMKGDEDLVIPEVLHIEFAVLREDPTEVGTPALNPFLYDGYRKVVEHYQKSSTFPTMEDFRSELKKTGEDRIAGLPTEATPQKFGYVKKDDVANMGFNLVFKDTLNKEE